MKRAIPRSVLEQMNAAKDTREEGGDTPSPGGVGGAWKAGVVAQVESDLGHLREDIAKAVLSGKREISLDPAQIDDPIGTDRRTGWIETESFDQLTESIEQNGQDVPVQVWPADPNWTRSTRACRCVGRALSSAQRASSQCRLRAAWPSCARCHQAVA